MWMPLLFVVLMLGVAQGEEKEPWVKLVEQYQTPKLEDPDAINDLRVNLLQYDLYEYANKPEVTDLLLKIIQEEDHFDLARCEALQIVEVFVEGDNPKLPEFRTAIQKLLKERDTEWFVKQFALNAYEEHFKP